MNDGNSGGIRIVAILGTTRPGNFTSKALALVIDEIEKQEDIVVDLIDPATMNLPLPGLGPDSVEPKTIQELVSKATGVVFSTPEYHGTYSSAAKLIIENLGFPSVLASKPVALVGVAAGQIGGATIGAVIDEIEKQEDIVVDLIDPATMNLPLPGLGPDSVEPKTIQTGMREF